jgi:hypothetical protein
MVMLHDVKLCILGIFYAFFLNNLIIFCKENGFKMQIIITRRIMCYEYKV